MTRGSDDDSRALERTIFEEASRALGAGALAAAVVAARASSASASSR